MEAEVKQKLMCHAGLVRKMGKEGRSLWKIDKLC